MRRSECMTAVMVLASAGTAGSASAAESASADHVTFDAIAERFQREMWNIRFS